MPLVTANRFTPQQIGQPPLPHTLEGVLPYLKKQQTVIQKLATSLSQVLTGMSMVGPDNQRPDPGNAGSFYYATDTAHLYEDDGNQWVTLV